MESTSPLLVWIVRQWPMKSKSIWKRRAPYGIGDVVKPRQVTYSGTCHQWFTMGACARRILPTTCVQRCSVAQVSDQSSSGRSGQSAVVDWI
jgi:hypothetical protein